ncbi:MAG: HAD-IIB family hydrolase [Bacilli bacterium]|nr:HAD-IIB family hydrolase [Bacilli bacterium]
MKILASDFDKTLYIDDEDKLNRNIEAIKKFIINGNLFCIITGRNYSNLKELLKKYNIPYSYLICQDGAKIYNNMDYSINTILLNSNDVEKICKLLESKDYPYYLDDGYNITNNYDDCVKVVIECSDKEKGKKIVDYIKENIDVYVYMSSKHVNIVSREVNKSNSLKKLAELENLNINDIYVIGDDINDMEMLKDFKGAVMKGHSKDLDNTYKKEYNYLYEYIEELMKN